jgi:hypothetical protein
MDVRLHQIFHVNCYIIIRKLLDYRPTEDFAELTGLFFHKSAYCIYELPICFMLVSCLIYSATLMMEFSCSSETPVDFQRTAWRYTYPRRQSSALKDVQFADRLFSKQLVG